MESGRTDYCGTEDWETMTGQNQDTIDYLCGPLPCPPPHTNAFWHYLPSSSVYEVLYIK